MQPHPAGTGLLATNLLHFGRVLRAAGLPVGTDRIALAQQALQVAGLASRRDFHAVLAACLVDRAEHRELFDQAFALFWKDPDLPARLGAALRPPPTPKPDGPATPDTNRRLNDALFPPSPGVKSPDDTPPPPADAALCASDLERLQRADFDTMSADEWGAAKAAIRRLQPLFEAQATRRGMPAPRPGRPDGRATLAAQARAGGDLPVMRWRRPRTRPAPLVVLADISGSMGRYSRLLLHFAHALGHADARVESFVFGTRLTRTTRLLASRDPDLAVGQVVRAVQDWRGGTRISACLHAFNQHWARRVLDSRATVLLVTDGLEQGDTTRLAFEAERLAKSCRRLLWLNPLLRYAGFQPRAAGIRALLPHVQRMLPAHNLHSLQGLVDLLLGRGGPAARR